MTARAWRRYSGYLFLLPYLTLFALFLVVPLTYGLGISLFRWELLSRVPPAFVGLENFREALATDNFWKALGATLRFVAMATPLTVGLALLIAVGLNSVGPSRQALYRAAFFVPTMVTISVAGILWRWFYNGEFGVLNALLAPFHLKAPWLTDVNWAMPSIVLMTLWWTVGGPMVILLAGLQNIGPQYLEAAALDGASSWQRFRHVVLPLLRPILFFVIIMNVIGSFQVFGQTFMITRGGPELNTRSLVQFIYETAFNNYRMGFAAAMSWLLFALIVLFSAVQTRMMREK